MSAAALRPRAYQPYTRRPAWSRHLSALYRSPAQGMGLGWGWGRHRGARGERTAAGGGGSQQAAVAQSRQPWRRPPAPHSLRSRTPACPQPGTRRAALRHAAARCGALQYQCAPASANSWIIIASSGMPESSSSPPRPRHTPTNCGRGGEAEPAGGRVGRPRRAPAGRHGPRMRRRRRRQEGRPAPERAAEGAAGSRPLGGSPG